MPDETLRKNLRDMEANVQISHLLLQEIIAEMPQAEKVLQRFLRTVDALTQNAPGHIDPEYLVELRARAQQTAVCVRLTMKDANAPQ
jgi:hypothetical protein